LPIKTQYQQYHIPILYKGWLAWFAKFNGHKSVYKTPPCEINRKVPNIGATHTGRVQGKKDKKYSGIAAARKKNHFRLSPTVAPLIFLETMVTLLQQPRELCMVCVLVC